jgi:hypothetical protein
MSIAAFYRNWFPFTQRYTYFDEGDLVEGFLPLVYVKGNIQPWKQGLIGTLTETGVIYKDYKSLYLKNFPVFDTSGVPVGATLDENPVVYWDGKWFDVNGNQDWTSPGRAPKHHKLLCIRRPVGPGDDPIPDPTPIPELVDAFELIVSELHQLTPLVIQGIT